MYSYSGPDSQMVTHRLRLSWLHYVASVEGFVVASADVMGSAARGRSFAYQMHRKLGNVEVGAQVAALKCVSFVPSPLLNAHLSQLTDMCTHRCVCVYARAGG